ncbi:hypothetical protein [Alicyclobacillus pomorum]|uniref:hypothetical protein n=1 Tax=Alicyclobacillus pomorum TaxID=204470 RepID=UPI0003FE8492|nr:hypothetical protein [Alicyclobacillus pomorum]
MGELAKIREQVGQERFTGGRYRQASELFLNLTANDEFVEFLTLPGYTYLD